MQCCEYGHRKLLHSLVKKANITKKFKVYTKLYKCTFEKNDSVVDLVFVNRIDSVLDFRPKCADLVRSLQ